MAERIDIFGDGRRGLIVAVDVYAAARKALPWGDVSLWLTSAEDLAVYQFDFRVRGERVCWRRLVPLLELAQLQDYGVVRDLGEEMAAVALQKTRQALRLSMDGGRDGC